MMTDEDRSSLLNTAGKRGAELQVVLLCTIVFIIIAANAGDHDLDTTLQPAETALRRGHNAIYGIIMIY